MITKRPWLSSSLPGSVSPRFGIPIVTWTSRNATPAPTMPAASARKPPTRASSERSWKTPRLAQKPAIRPMTPATGAKNAIVGPAPPGIGRIDQMRLARMPVSAPAHGPASAPTRTVPIESR